MQELFIKSGENETTQKQAIFTSIFVLQNRLQTACERIQTEITMKQWLLLAMTGACADRPSLTNVGNLMGCSRQNTKKLALALERKGLLKFKKVWAIHFISN